MRSGRFEEKRQPPFVREVSVARCVRAKSHGIASGGALLCHTPTIRKQMASMLHPMFFFEMHYLSAT